MSMTKRGNQMGKELRKILFGRKQFRICLVVGIVFGELNLST
jgi:hypothetical protein